MIRLLFWAAFGLILASVTAFVVTGISLVPTTVALGPCLKDYTSPNSYGKRASPLGSVTFDVDGEPVRVCYGRPSARERVVFGGLVRYGQLWRTGANEPTRLYTGHTIALAGIELEPGRYTIYTIPDEESWRIFINHSVLHWGNDMRDGVRDQEVGFTIVPSDTTAEYVEMFTISAEPDGSAANLVLEWERTRVVMPVRAVGRSGGLADESVSPHSALPTTHYARFSLNRPDITLPLESLQ